VMMFSLLTAFGKKVSLVIGLVVLSAFQAQAFDKAHRETLLSTNDCKECNLRGANLRGADLSGADLRYADLRGAKANLETGSHRADSTRCSSLCRGMV